MHQPPENTTDTRRFTRRLVLALVVLLAGVVQVGLRTDAFVRPAIEPRLEDVARRWNGRLHVAHIQPHGLLGVELHGLEFRPHRWAPERDIPLVRIDRVVVEPDLGALLSGRAEARRIVLDTPRVTALLDAEGGPLDEWIDWLADDLRSNRPTPGPAEPVATGSINDWIARLPEVDVRGGFVTIDDRAGRYPSAGVRLDTIRFRPDGPELDGTLHVEGLGRAELSGTPGEDRIALRLLDARDLRGVLPNALPADADATMSVGAISVAWPPRVSVTDLQMNGLAIGLPGSPDGRIRAFGAGELSLAFDNWGLTVEAADAQATLALDDAPYVVDVARLHAAHAWDDRESRAEGTVLDTDGDALTFAIDRRDGGDRISASADGDDLDLARLANLLPLPVEARVQEGTVTVHADLVWDAERGQASGHIEASGTGLTLDAPLLSSTTVRGLGVEIDTRYAYRPASGAFDLRELRATMPELGLVVQADALLSPERFRLDARATVPRRPAREFLRALPVGLAPTLQGLRANGELGFDLLLSLDTDAPAQALAWFELDAPGFEVEQFGPLAPIDALTDDDFALPVTTYEGRRRRIGPGTESWTPLIRMPAHAYRAVLAAEDDGFFRHEGFDMRGIRRALEVNLSERRLARGGSTITQQVVKNLFLGHDRTVSRKLQEAFLTWQIEARVPKTRILELYLNLAHWGPDVYGIDGAAHAYFGHPVDALTVREAAFLAAILPNPNLFAPLYLDATLPAARWVKMIHVIDNMERGGFLTEATADAERAALRRGAISRTPPPERLGEHLPLLEDAPDVVLPVPELDLP